MDKLLRVEAPHFVAGAVFRKDPEWRCIQAAPILKWMVDKDPVQIKRYLKQKNWAWMWL